MVSLLSARNSLDLLVMKPRCEAFGNCGGCTRQDQEYRVQLRSKEQALRSLLEDCGRDAIPTWLPAVTAEPWAYRSRARLSVRDLGKEAGVVIGFRHRWQPRQIVDLAECPILGSDLENLLAPLHTCVEQMEARFAIPQIDLIGAENGQAMIVRHVQPLPDRDLQQLSAFATSNKAHIFLQNDGPESLASLDDEEPFQPCYRLPVFNLTFRFSVTQFTQVNPAVNRQMVDSVIDQLEPQEGEAVADLFCGVGNFALAAARKGAQVSGWEWSQDSVDCAQANAEANGLQEQAAFYRDDLDRASQEKCRRLNRFDKFILDPPRSGAEALMHCLPRTGRRRVVYVSCQPKTLARDARILIHERGYRLVKAGLIDMFPHTDHIEALAVFERS